MADFDEERKKRSWEDEEDEGGSGQGSGTGGGQGGRIEFADFLPSGKPPLSEVEEKQKLAEHKEKNGALVEKQKKLRDERKEVKEGKNNNPYQLGARGGNGKSSYKTHPILGQSAEFDGADPQMSLDPTINEAATNSEKKEELTYQYQKRFELLNQSKFVPPKPLMGG